MSETASDSYNPDAIGAALSAQIKLANMALGLVPPGQPVDALLRDEIEHTLDEAWMPYTGDYCAFSGLCQVIRPHVRPRTEFIDFAEGLNSGFYVIKAGVPGQEYATTAFRFSNEIEGDGYQTDYFLLTAAAHAVVPYGTVDESFPEDLEFPDLHRLLSEHSDDIAANMQDDAFFELAAEEQKYYVDKSLSEAEEALQRFGGIYGKKLCIGGEYAYATATSQAGNCYVSVDISECYVNGNCTGIMVLERQRLAADVQIARPEDMVHSGSGICLKVALDAETAEMLELVAGIEIYIPVSGQDLEVIFAADYSQQS